MVGTSLMLDAFRRGFRRARRVAARGWRETQAITSLLRIGGFQELARQILSPPARACDPVPGSPPLACASLPAWLALSRTEAEAACRALCQTVYLGDRTALCRVLGKYLMYVDTTDRSLAPHLLLSGFWEMWITQTVVRALQPGWNCVDVGANHGYYSLLLADAVSPDGKVLCCEPNPRMADLLDRSLRVNGFTGNARVVREAIADTDGAPVELIVPPNEYGGAHVRAATGSGLPVRTVCLDTLCAGMARVDFIKIDAEGAEEPIWRGMGAIRKSNPQLIVLMEFSTPRYPVAQAFLESIQSEGFRLRHLDVDGQIKEVPAARLLQLRPGDLWMLWLQR